jgi:hypothetical protein
VLTTADDALMSAAEARDKTSEKVDKKFEEAIHLLVAFKKDFPYEDLALDPNISGVVTGEEKMLYALKWNSHRYVRFLFVSFPLGADEF